MTANEKKVYSYHNFILPFAIQGNGKITSNVNDEWDVMASIEEFPYLENQEIDKEKIGYACKRYFNQDAKELIYTNHELVKNYCYKGTQEIYRISYYDKAENLRFYDLKVTSIFLRIYEGVRTANLVICTENYSYPSLDDINAINQYGRRIYNPFLMDDKSYLEAPNDLKLLTREEEAIEPEKSSNLVEYKIMSAPKILLKSFFGYDDNSIFPEKKPTEDRQHLSILIDDRMFVHSIIASKEFSSMIKKTGNFENFFAEENNKEMERLYKYSFIDKGDATCQSFDLLKDALSKCLYRRWVNYGTLYVVTPHSFLFLAGSEMKDVPGFLKTYFKTEYLEMVLMVIAQRQGLLYFSQIAGQSSEESSQDIISLQKRYTIFQNQFLLPEISAQEQAIELYDLLQDSLYVPKYEDILDRQITSLYEISQNKLSTKQNKTANMLTFLGLVLALPDNFKKIQIIQIIKIIIILLIIGFVFFDCMKFHIFKKFHKFKKFLIFKK